MPENKTDPFGPVLLSGWCGVSKTKIGLWPAGCSRLCANMGMPGDESEGFFQCLVPNAGHLRQLAQLAQMGVFQSLTNALHGMQAQARLLGNLGIGAFKKAALNASNTSSAALGSYS